MCCTDIAHCWEQHTLWGNSCNASLALPCHTSATPEMGNPRNPDEPTLSAERVPGLSQLSHSPLAPIPAMQPRVCSQFLVLGFEFHSSSFVHPEANLPG